MTQETHSPEPWAYDPTDNSVVADNEYGRWIVAEFVGERDARRIVACVNGCTGIPTEALESGALAELIEAAKGAAYMVGAGHRLRAALAKLGAAK